MDHARQGPTSTLMKQVNRQFVTGVTVVTAMDDEKPAGPCGERVLQHLPGPADGHGCGAAHVVHARLPVPRTHLAINILSTDQLDVVGVFATKADDKFAGLDWEPGPFGSPLIERSGAQMEVEIRERLQASTHTLFVCRVVHATVSDRHPMVYSAGKFFDGGALTPLG